MTENETPNEKDNSSQSMPWWQIGLLAVMVITVGFYSFRMIAIGIGFLFPPEPPLPPNVEEINHTRVAHGVDEWQYHRVPSPCDTIDFYVENGGTCDIQVGYCSDEPDAELLRESALAATCEGEVPFSAFVMGWDAEIWDYTEHTRILLNRNIPWTRSR
jgi:hypothetical protein